jgi:TolB-like protein/DNA-binding winged helix-turn-helix (wHTH) protein/Flp pilus assembly protein TadD
LRLDVQTPSACLFKFGSFDLDPLGGELRHSGELIKLQPQPFKVLVLLVSRAGQLVTREELRQQVWGDNTFVDFEHGLNFCISQIREVLQDIAGHPQFVETVPRRGYRFVAPVEAFNLAAPLPPPAPSEVAPTTPAASRWFRRVVVLGIAGLIVSALFYQIRSAAWRPAARIRSIAVLPLVNLSGDPNQDYFADGMTEALITTLSKLRELKVISRTSVMQYKGTKKPLPQIARELGVDGIIEGSVLRSGTRVRITAQLIRAATDTHLWGDNFDRDPRDVLTLQSEVARAIAEQVSVAATPAGQQQLASGGQVNPHGNKNVEAYNAYLQGKYFFWRSSKENMQKAIAYYEQAIQLDPGYASAWAGLAQAHLSQADGAYVPIDEGYRKAGEAAERALALDAKLAEAHAAMGHIKTAHEWDWVGADASYKRALALEPGNATVVGDAAVLAETLGRFEEAMALERRSLELDPLNAPGHLNFGYTTYNAGRLQEAVAATQKALELDPNIPGAHFLLGLVYLAHALPQDALAEMERESERPLRLYGKALAYYALGKKNESDAALAEFVANYQAVDAYQVAEVYAFRGESDRAFAWLERAYAQHDSGLTLIKGDPLLKNVRSDPRYAAFLKKMRLPA